MEEKQERMLMMDQILQFLGVSQEKIEESVFDMSFSFEKKREYNPSEHIPIDLFSPPRKKKVIPNREQRLPVSMFSEEPSMEEERKPRPMKKIPVPCVEERSVRQYMNLPKSWNIDVMEGYKILSKRTKNRNAVFTFMDSFVSIMDESFWMKTEDDKRHFLHELLKKMHAEMYIDGNYQKFYYHKSRKMKKSDLFLTMSQSIQFRIQDMDHFYMLQQYAVDYFGVNLLIFFVSGSDEIDYEKSKAFTTKQFENHMNPYVPTLCMIWKDEIYYGMVHETDGEKSILKYSRDEEILKKMWRSINLHDMFNFFLEKRDEKKEGDEEEIPSFSTSQLQKMKMEELQKICQDMGISIEKLSEKTGKSIKKTKTEMIDEIAKYQ